MIVDTHVHYSQKHSPERPYDPRYVNSDVYLTIGPPHPVEEILAAAAAAGVDRIVQITETKMGFDNRYGLECAARFPDRILGVIGRFDPFAPDLRARLRDYAADPSLLGVRFTLVNAWSEPWLRERALDPFLAAAGELDVPVQIFAPDQLAELTDHVRRFRGVRFLIDHMALYHIPPRPMDEVFSSWNAVIALAQEPNVWLKVSYFPEAASFTEAFPYPRAQGRFRELYERAGAARLVWGSNFPPVDAVCSYRDALEFVRRCDFLSETDRTAILGENFLAAFVSPKN